MMNPFPDYQAADFTDDDGHLLGAAHQAGAVFLNDDATVYAFKQDDLLKLIKCALRGDFRPLLPKDYPGDDLTMQETLALIGLRAAQELAHKTATDAGWYRDPVTGEPVTRNFGEVCMLMVTEIGEAVEADRKGLMDDKLPHRDGREVEFADCIIRILDTSAALGLDVAGALIEKNRLNKTRADHKLANRAAAGGKKY
jgi:hypothetical protein